MLERHRLSALAAIALGAIAPACATGSDTVPGTGGNAAQSSSSSGAGGMTTATGTGGAGGSGTGGAAPANGCKPSGDTVLAINRLYFGDTNWDDTPNTSNGWKLYGLDIDGKASTGSSTDVCLPAYGGAASIAYPDGPNGLDNAFGKNVLPVFLQSIPALASQANQALSNGDFTILIRLGALGSAPDQGSISTKVYGGAFLSTIIPAFDGNDCWPVAPESLVTSTDIESAKLTYPASSLTLNRWDSVGTGDLDLTLQVLGFQGHAIIHHARIVMDLDADHQGTQKGIISGVLDTEEFVAAINKLMASFDPANCSPNANMQAVDTLIRQASDIMKDGTQDPASACTGISIGLGFKAKRVQFGAIGSPLAPKPDPCP
ncbi:MAG: hypothetical protein QM820_45260 [Minicystis sp.]